MRKATLKISAVLLCGLLIYNSLGYFLVLSVMRVAIQHQKWAELLSIPESRLTTYVFEKNKQNTRFTIVNNREIIVDGKLFDIARIVDDGLTITYYCLHDSREEKLISKTRQFNAMAQHLPVKNTAKLIIENIIKNCIFDKTPSTYKQDNNVGFLNIADLTYPGPVISILLPPPQQCF